MEPKMNEIETRFYDNLLLACKEVDYQGDDWAARIYQGAKENEFFINATGFDEENTSEVIFSIFKQAKNSKYRIDFVLAFMSKNFPDLHFGVEVDGHEWHEKTKEQARRDKKRQRDLLAAGVPIIRFTGSEVFCNAYDCAYESIEICLSYLFINNILGNVYE